MLMQFLSKIAENISQLTYWDTPNTILRRIKNIENIVSTYHIFMQVKNIHILFELLQHKHHND